MTHYWFKPRAYGYGVAPVTWEGWAVTFAATAAVAGSIVAMSLWVNRSDFTAWMIWAAVIAVVAFGFVRVAKGRTDGEWRWRWGEADDPRH
jgi:hypothetical protein